MRYARVAPVALFTVLALAAPASACLNDNATYKSEEEFRSPYLKSLAQKPKDEATGEIKGLAGALNPAGVAALIVGAGAATGAVVAVFLKKGA